MTLDNYLRLIIKLKLYKHYNWIISAFTVTRETESQRATVYPGKLIREPFGFFVINEEGERVQLTTARKPDEELLRKYDKLTLTPDALPSIQGTIETTVGTLLLNLLTVYEPFGTKIPYINKPFTPKTLEAIVAPKLQSNVPHEQRKPDLFYVDELLVLGEAVGFVETLSAIFCNSITEAGLLPAPGRKEFKKALLKKYEGKLTDPVEMAAFEEELRQYDTAYLKANDPSYGKFMSGKVKESRMKLYMTQGGESNSFTESLKVTPIVPALEDGFPIDQEGFTAVSNTIRYGSFSRGAETVNGGVAAKGLQRAADTWRITEGDCGATLGIRRHYGANDIENIVGLYVILNGKSVLIENLEQAKPYINRKIVLRSPQFCRRDQEQTCTVCAGQALSKFPTGVTIPLMEISGGLLNDSLKKMHNTALSTALVDLESAIS